MSGKNVKELLIYISEFHSIMQILSNLTKDYVNSTGIIESDEKRPIIYISPDGYKQFEYIVNIILTPVICIIGLFGSSLGLYILMKDNKKKQLTIYTYLLTLLMLDLVYLLFGIIVSFTEIVKLVDFSYANYAFRYFQIYRGYIDIVLNHVITAMIVIMSLERLLSFICPYDVKDLCLNKYPRTIVLITFLISAAYLTPFIFSFGVFSYQNAANQTVYDTKLTRKWFEFLDTFSFIETIILHFVGPSLILSLNISIYIANSRFIRQRSADLKSAQSDNSQRKITLVVLAVGGLYLILTLPNLFVQTLVFIDDDYSFYGKFELTFLLFINLGDLLARINASADFFVYILVSKRYRAILSSTVWNRYRFFQKNLTKGHDSSKIQTTSESAQLDKKPYIEQKKVTKLESSLTEVTEIH